MVQAGIEGLDTPRTNVGDRTYMSTAPQDFDISQEQSFMEPTKDKNDLFAQLKNGRRGGNTINTPRRRVALNERRNLPPGLSGGEFTPMLKSATRNSALRNGKENMRTPAFLKSAGLGNIVEDLSPLPMDSSAYGSGMTSYIAGTPAQIESSSTASTPMAVLSRRDRTSDMLQDGNQLSLREQENVIDKIEKENFGLKLKIHFLEEALRKAGPGFSEMTLRENTELKVDKVTMTKDLVRFKKTLSIAERDVEVYRQQLLEAQEKMKRKHMDEDQIEELERLRQALDDRDGDLSRIRGQENQLEDLEDKIEDLKAEAREKDRTIEDHEDEIGNLKDELEKQAATIEDMEEAAKKSQRRAVELEEQAQASEELDEAKETIVDLEQQIRKLQNELTEAKEDAEEATREKERAVEDLEELHDEIANKSMTSKGFSRQIEEKNTRLQDELEDLRGQYTTLEKEYDEKSSKTTRLERQLDEIIQASESRERKLLIQLEDIEKEKQSLSDARSNQGKRLDSLKKDLQSKSDEKNLLQLRHDSLTSESAGLQKDLAQAKADIDDLNRKLDHEKELLKVRNDSLDSESAELQKDLAKLRREVEDLTSKLDREKSSASLNERELREEYKGEIDRLNDIIDDLKADLHRKQHSYDDNKESWESERRKLESQKEIVEERASGLQRTINRLQEMEGTLSGKESKLQEAVQSEVARREAQEATFKRQIDDLNDDLESKRASYEQARSELSAVKEELRLSQREQKLLTEKAEGLEDEVEILQTSLDDEAGLANKEISAAKQESDSLRRQLQTLKLDLAKAESEAVRAQADLEAFQGDLQAGQGSTELLSARLREIESQLAKSRQDKQAVQDQLTSLTLELHTLRSTKADVEAERDELHSQLRAFKQQEDETYQINQDRVSLRSAKLKLDNEIKRLKDENKAVLAQQEALENDLQQEIERSTTEVARLNNEILDLQRILRGSSEKRDLASAKKTIEQLERRIREVESQASPVTHESDTQELSFMRRDLAAARQKTAEHVHRESAQKDTIRSLKRQIQELERKAHDAELSRFVNTPQSSANGSARKSELYELRAQLSTSHQTLKELRAQLKTVEKETQRKINMASLELDTQQAAWESEKDSLEHALEQVEMENKELQTKNATSEANISRLRSKIERLEKSLQTERLKPSDDRLVIQERQELHEILRETQLQVETLSIVVKDREKKISALASSEDNLRTQIKRIRGERSEHKSAAIAASDQVVSLKQKYKKAQQTWESEKRNLTKGVRFPHQSISVNDESQLLVTLKQEWDQKAHTHVKEMRGMNMQVEWLMAKIARMENFRSQAAYAKKFMSLQIEAFEAWYVLYSGSFMQVADKTSATRRILHFSNRQAFRDLCDLLRRRLFGRLYMLSVPLFV